MSWAGHARFDAEREGASLTYALVAAAALMLGLYNVFIKFSADHIDCFVQPRLPR